MRASPAGKLTAREEAPGVAEGGRVLHDQEGRAYECGREHHKAQEGTPQAGDGDVRDHSQAQSDHRICQQVAQCAEERGGLEV